MPNHYPYLNLIPSLFLTWLNLENRLLRDCEKNVNIKKKNPIILMVQKLKAILSYMHFCFQLLGLKADVLYCQKLLEEEGVLAGAGEHGEMTDSFHLR